MQYKRFHYRYESEGANYKGTWIAKGSWMVWERGTSRAIAHHKSTDSSMLSQAEDVLV